MKNENPTFIKFCLTPKRISAFMLLLFINSISFCQDINIFSQVQIDNFDPSITTINGDLYISGTDITNLNGLSNLTTITGYLDIFENPVLSNINGLSNLTTIGGYLLFGYNDALTNINGLNNLTTIDSVLIGYNAALTNISGLSNLATIGKLLWVLENPTLTNIDGFANLTSLDGRLWIFENAALTNINGLANLTTIGRSLDIHKNAALSNINGLANLTSIGESLNIFENAALTNINGLANLTAIGSNMGIGYNPSLTNIDGLSNLITFDGDLGIGYNATLNNLEGLSNITTVNDLGILENAALTNVDGLVNLTTIGGDLIIVNNPVLTNINGFSNITTAGDLWVGENAALTNVDGLVNLTTLGNLTILENAALTNIDSLVNVTSISDSLVISDNVSLTNCCGIKQLLETPGAITGSITIENNPSECSSTDEILNSPCNKCWEEDLLKFCLTSSQWEPVEGEENKIESTDIVSINEFLFFEGHLVIDTIELDISAEGEFYVENIPLPGGSTGKYLLSEGEFDLKLLGSDGIITDFLNSDIEGTPKIFETELKLDEIKLVKINNETGLKLKCTITVPGISGDCGDEPGTNTEIQLDGLGITAAGISLDGVNVKDLGMYIPKFCLKQLTVQYDSPKDILTAGAEVSMPFGEIGGGLKLEEGLIDSIGWMIEASSPPFVLGTTTIGIKGFFGQIANITKPAIEVELGGIFSDIISDDFYRITAKGKTVWPTNFEISGTGQFMRPLSNDLPFQLQGGLSVGYDIPNSLLNVQVNGNFGTLNEEKWLMSGDGLLRVNHRTTNTTFNGYFNGLMNVDVDVFVDDPPMPLPYIISVIGLPFSVGTKNTVHYGNNKNFFGSITLEHFLLGSYDLSYLIDLTLPMSHEDYFFWDGIKKSASRSQNRLDGEQIIVPEQTDYTIIHVISEILPPVSTISSPSGKIYTTSSEDDRILYSEGLNGKEAFWTILEPQAGTWMIELVNPASTDSVFYYNSEKINEFEYTVEQDGSIITLSWDPTYLEVGETVNALLDDDSEDFNGFQIAEADATAGSLSFELDSSTPDCQYYLYAELLEGIKIQQVYSDDILYNSNSALAPPQNFRAEFISDTVGFAFSWDAIIANDIAGYNIIVSDNTGNDSVYATLHPAETSITLFIEDYENKSVLIESFDEEWRIGCPSVLSTLSQNCSVVSTILLETICEGETYAVGNSVYSATGVYSDILVTTEGCDSTITLNLTVIHLNKVITEEDGVLISNEENATSYQWFDCNSGEDIMGADQQSFTPNQTGNYAVRIEKDECEVTSDCMLVTGIEEFDDTGISLYPNPANNEIHVSIQPNIQIGANILCHDIMGRGYNLLVNDGVIDTSDLLSGLYILVLKINDAEYRTTIVILK